MGTTPAIAPGRHQYNTVARPGGAAGRQRGIAFPGLERTEALWYHGGVKHCLVLSHSGRATEPVCASSVLEAPARWRAGEWLPIPCDAVVQHRNMNTPAAKRARRRRRALAPGIVPGGWCSRCALCGPAGECLDDVANKSGRCGDWVWYVRDGHQWRRRWLKPFDPKTAEATGLAGAPGGRLEGLQRGADRRTTGCLHCRGRQAADPAPAGRFRPADRAAVFGGQGMQGQAARARPAGWEAEILSGVGASALGERVIQQAATLRGLYRPRESGIDQVCVIEIEWGWRAWTAGSDKQRTSGLASNGSIGPVGCPGAGGGSAGFGGGDSGPTICRSAAGTQGQR